MVTTFKPSVNGLHFTNTWPPEPDIIVNVPPLGNVPIGDAYNGLCGGMVFTALDVFMAGLPPIPDTTNPPQGSPLFNYIVSRLIASFNLPGGVLKYYDWMNTPDHDTGISFAIRRGVAWHTIVEELPKINVNIQDSNGNLLPVRGFFRVDYTFSNPASLEPVTPLPSNAYFVSQSVQSPLIPGQVSNVSVTLQNIGGVTWTSQGNNPFRLGSQNPQDNATWGLARVDVPSNVAPGDEVTFNFTITAPAAPGTYNFQWRMVEEMVAWFGDTTPDVPVVVQPVLRQMIVHVQPFPVPVGRPIVLTVFAQDAQTGTSVAGKVSFNGVVVASTNTPFNYTLPIKRVFDPETKHWIPEPDAPDGEVTAPGYATAHIDFGV